MTPIGGVVFDLDGTLVDSRTDIAAAANLALERHGLPQHSVDRIGTFVGDGAHNLIARASGLSTDCAEFSAVLSTFLDYYEANACRSTTLMPGARAALLALGGIPLALLTNKPRRATIPLLDALDIARSFCCVVAGGDLSEMKPHPKPLLEIARRIGVPPTSLVMVGDGPQDVECGRNANAFTVGVAGGIAAPERLQASRPDRLITSLAELPTVVAEFAATSR